jgi:hypothetical protein
MSKCFLRKYIDGIPWTRRYGWECNNRHNSAQTPWLVIITKLFPFGSLSYFYSLNDPIKLIRWHTPRGDAWEKEAVWEPLWPRNRKQKKSWMDWAAEQWWKGYNGLDSWLNRSFARKLVVMIFYLVTNKIEPT